MTVDESVQAIRERKGLVFVADKSEKQKATLTPVGTEKPLVPPDVPGVLMAREGVVDVAADLRKQAAFLISVADGLDALTGKPTAVVAFVERRVEVEQKLMEREADRKAAEGKGKLSDEEQAAFEARMRTLSATAQASVYAGDLTAAAREMFEMADAKSGSADLSWVCPTHGSAHLIQLKSRKGRDYMSCTAADCGKFEK